jgi:hypothetical protein
LAGRGLGSEVEDDLRVGEFGVDWVINTPNDPSVVAVDRHLLLLSTLMPPKPIRHKGPYPYNVRILAQQRHRYSQAKEHTRRTKQAHQSLDSQRVAFGPKQRLIGEVAYIFSA